jgi:hypothetical protein
MAGSFSKRRLSTIIEEMGLVSEPFTFVLDAGGMGSSRVEGFATEGEIEVALKATVGPWLFPSRGSRTRPRSK